MDLLGKDDHEMRSYEYVELFHDISAEPALPHGHASLSQADSIGSTEGNPLLLVLPQYNVWGAFCQSHGGVI
jgi:hypothetical protein